MKVLALNGSPRKEMGSTDHVLNYFLDAARNAGGEVTKHYAIDLDINGCIGCFGCWWRTPGKCVHKDDMNQLLEEILDSDMLVWAGPVYHDNIIHYLQRIRERTLPLAMPEFILDNAGETVHPGRYKKQRKNVVIATAGFPESSAFDVTLRLFQDATHIHLPASVMFAQGEEFPLIQEFKAAIVEAARRLVKGKEVDSKLRSKLRVVYPEDVKAEIIKRHNRMSEQITPSN